jgi:ElaB/YqjD/DUF883 family membrane-anchored ribosome-binding protein
MNDNSTPLNADTIGSADGSWGNGAADTMKNTATEQSLTDRARNIADTAQDKLADVGSAVRERAGATKDSLADVLDSGADKLRSSASSESTASTDGQFAGATSAGSVAVEHDGRVAQVSGKVADGMSATADWLRNADLDGLKATVEDQVKNHPGRTLLVAAGVGYLLGKALKK